jgi:hypothetical protein
MLTGIHFILTYSCNFECDHCFVYCSPRAQGTFTISQVARALNEARKIDTVEWIFFEGGEPLLYFPLLKESIRRASELGFKVGIVTNAYAASSQEDAELWLKPLADSGLSFLNISNDAFHYGGEAENPATVAASVAEKLGIETETISIEPPEVLQASPDAAGKGLPVVGGGAMFRGRAADTLTGDLPRRPWGGLCECPYEDLESPSRVHVDSYGNVQICQGISIGNMWLTPLSEIILGYRSGTHPICAPLLRGGPAELANELVFVPEPGYVDECHLCYSTRRAAIDEFPDHLAPRQVYGLD